jgi:RNA polymerase sigma-70 factor, ECF subfamily
MTKPFPEPANPPCRLQDRPRSARRSRLLEAIRDLASHVHFAVMRCESTCEMQTLTTNGDPCMDLSGDQSAVLALKEVLSLRMPAFYRCAWRLLGNAADAEDAVQEAVLAAYRHIDQFRGQAQLATWLTAIVRNCALMQLRKRHRQIHLSWDEQTGGEEQYFVWETIADTRPSPEEECRNFELFARLRECAALLSPALRKTFLLRVVDGLSILETAQVLGVPQGTVKAQMARARRKVVQYMQRALEPRSRTPPRAYRTSGRRKAISRVD